MVKLAFAHLELKSRISSPSSVFKYLATQEHTCFPWRDDELLPRLPVSVTSAVCRRRRSNGTILAVIGNYHIDRLTFSQYDRCQFENYKGVRFGSCRFPARFCRFPGNGTALGLRKRTWRALCRRAGHRADLAATAISSVHGCGGDLAGVPVTVSSICRAHWFKSRGRLGRFSGMMWV